MIKIDLSAIKGINKTLDKYKNKLSKLNSELSSPNYKYKDFIGWHKLDDFIYDEIKLIDTTIASLPSFDTLVVIGIGGSYLGLVAAMEFLRTIKAPEKELLMAGFDTSGYNYNELFNKLVNKKFIINVISKSGTTMETLIAYNILKEKMISVFPDDYQKRIIITTNDQSGTLYDEAKCNNYPRLNVPNNIGGRYSVLTSVGLFALRVLGYDILKIVDGALLARDNFSTNDISTNYAMQYAIARYVMYKKGYSNELLATFGMDTYQIGFWWQQLFAESEGKNKQALFPVPLYYSRDLHSVGQYVQDGSNNNFETFFFEEKETQKPVFPFTVPFSMILPYDEKKINFIEKVIFDATYKAHLDSGKNIIKITFNNKTEELLGYIFYFFEKACAYSSELLGLNPYDQPGVEAYKKNMKEILKGDNNE